MAKKYKREFAGQIEGLGEGMADCCKESKGSCYCQACGNEDLTQDFVYAELPDIFYDWVREHILLAVESATEEEGYCRTKITEKGFKVSFGTWSIPADYYSKLKIKKDRPANCFCFNTTVVSILEESYFSDNLSSQEKANIRGSISEIESILEKMKECVNNNEDFG